MITYNKDYLPNGFDFENKNISDYLHIRDLGDRNQISQYRDPNSVNENQKKSLTLSFPFGNILRTTSFAWTNDFYPSFKKDQEELQSDLIWKVKNEENSYYSVFADPNLKNDRRFKTFLDHLLRTNRDAIFAQGDGTWEAPDEHYFLRAIFNGHVGRGVVMNYTSLDLFNTQFRSTGTDEQKRNFIREKIRFQPLPSRTAFSNGVVSALASSLRNDEKKQEVDETFINIVTNSNNANDFYSQIRRITPRKDIKHDGSVLSQYIKAIADSSPLLPLNTNIEEGIDSIFYAFQTTYSSSNTSTISEEFINELKSKLIATKLLEPIDP